MISKINKSIDKFKLDLSNQIVLTEAATGSYSCTPIIALQAGASKVYALAKETSYGNYEDIENGFVNYKTDKRLKVIKSLDEIDDKINIVTNSGFIRPINHNLLKFLTRKSVVTLMYEPWEFRASDIDIDFLCANDIKVYGTNEHDSRLKTMDYIGLTALNHILNYKITHFSENKILLLGNFEFTEPIEKILIHNRYLVTTINDYNQKIDIKDYDIVVVAENKNNNLLIGCENAYILNEKMSSSKKVIHICGNVDFSDLNCLYIPNHPAPFGYMSFRTDFIDNMALIDLQTASLKVAEGMLKANTLGLVGHEYKIFMEENYPALSFENKKYW